MVEITRLSPLATAKPPHGLEIAAPFSRFSLRMEPNAPAFDLASLSLRLPAEACRGVSSAKGAALWLGPADWLLLSQEPDTAKLEQALRAELAGTPCSLVEISHRQMALTLSGPQAALWLNAVCPLDLDLAAFPVGYCTRTVFAKAQIVLWRTAEACFHLEVWRSFAPYVLDMLSIIMAEAA